MITDQNLKEIFRRLPPTDGLPSWDPLNLAMLRFDIKAIPFSGHNRKCVIDWLRQVADEMEEDQMDDHCYLAVLGYTQPVSGPRVKRKGGV